MLKPSSRLSLRIRSYCSTLDISFSLVRGHQQPRNVGAVGWGWGHFKPAKWPPGPLQNVIPKSFTQDDPTCPSSHCSTSFTSAVAPQPVVAGSNTCATYAESGDTDTDPITMIGCSTETDPLGNATSYGWNVTDQVVKIVNAEHIVTQNVYGTNNNGDPTTGSDALANQTTTAFNSNLDATSATAPASASGQTAAVSDLAYNTTGATNPGYLPSSYVDPSGDCAYMSYDTAGNMTNTWTGQSSTSGTGTTRSCTKTRQRRRRHRTDLRRRHGHPTRMQRENRRTVLDHHPQQHRQRQHDHLLLHRRQAHDRHPTLPPPGRHHLHL